MSGTEILHMIRCLSSGDKKKLHSFLEKLTSDKGIEDSQEPAASYPQEDS